MPDTETAGVHAATRPPTKPRHHPLLYLLFLLNLLELLVWAGCICSASWSQGPFPSFQTNPAEYWESSVLFGPWFTCRTRYYYDVYAVWREPVLPFPDRFTAVSSCWSSLRYREAGDMKRVLIESMAVSGGGVLISAAACCVLWVLWVGCNVAPGVIRRVLLPVVKSVQVVCGVVVMLCLVMLTPKATRLWGYYIALGLFGVALLTVMGQLVLAGCAKRFKLVRDK